MKPEEQIEALAKLDGWTDIESNYMGKFYGNQNGEKSSNDLIPNYLNSYDAIIPVLKKQDDLIKKNMIHILANIFYGDEKPENQWYDCQVIAYHSATSAQLAEALLRATNLWKYSYIK